MEYTIYNLNAWIKIIHQENRRAGWWKIPVGEPIPIETIATKLCLIHSEISEALEGARKDLMDDHLPNRKMCEVELADAIIRIADLAGALEYDLAGAIEEKRQFNRERTDHKLEARNSPNGKSI